MRRVIIPVVMVALALSFVPVVMAGTFTVSVDFATQPVGSSYPGGWDGDSSCVPTGLTGDISGSATVGDAGGSLSSPALLGDTDKWLVIHRAVSSDTVLHAGGVSVFAGYGSSAIFVTQVYILACDGTTPIYENLFTCSGHASCSLHALSDSEITNPTDIYIYVTDCMCGAPGILNSLSLTADGDSSPWGTDTFGAGGPYKPISSADLVHISDDHSVVETRPNANVHNIRSGTIMNVSQSALGTWIVAVLPDGVSDVEFVLYYNNLQSVFGAVGDPVTNGCVLGLAAKSTEASADPSSGGLMLGADQDTLDNWPDYEDGSDTPCDADKYQTENCLNLNPNFADGASHWNSTFGVTFSGGVLSLDSGSAIFQDIPNLSTETPYYLTIYASAPYVPAATNLEVSLGGTNITLNVPSSQNNQYVKVLSSAITVTAPDFDPNLYRLLIKYQAAPANVVLPAMKIRFVCLAGTEATAAPGSCYWPDPDLNENNWTTAGGVTYQSPSQLSGISGRYVVPADGLIYRAVSIAAFVDADVTFNLLTKTKAGTGAPLTPPYGRWHAYIRDHDTEDLIIDIGEWDELPVVVTVHVEPFTLTSGTNAIGDLVIENTSSEIDSTGWTQEIYKACLQVQGGIWPSYDNTDTHEIFSQECELCSQPGDPGDITVENLLGWVVQWLGFGWCYLGFILKCLIYGLVNNIWATITNFMLGVALFGKWVGLVVGVVALWLRDGARFIFNNFLAGITPMINAILTWLLSLPIIQGAIDTLSIAQIWIDGLFGLVTDVINLILLGVQFIGALLNLIGVAWSAFLAALSSTPSTDFPFPNCSNPSSPLYHACVPLDVTNFLVTRVPALVLLINVAAFSVFWRQFRKIIRVMREDIFNSA